MIGLKRGTVKLEKHQNEWINNAKIVINTLKDILGDTAVDIQHIGSTSILSIHSKPIIDIVIGTRNLEDIKKFIAPLEKKQIIYRGKDIENQLLFVMGDFKKDTRTHHIHVVIWNSIAWNNYINFRDYLNAFPEKAKEYDYLKQRLAKEYYSDRVLYTKNKQELIDKLLVEAAKWKNK